VAAAWVTGYVYLVRAGDLYKIGKAKDPTKRVRDLPRRLGVPELVWSIGCDQPRLLEKLVQKRFAAMRAGGEWFRLDDAAVGMICSLPLCRFACPPAWLLKDGVAGEQHTGPVPEQFRASRGKEGHNPRGIMAPADLWAAIDAVAASTGRTPMQEVLHAMERHAANPPTLETPPLPDVKVEAGAKAKRPGRRPKRE
jgi:hypothetical protein